MRHLDNIDRQYLSENFVEHAVISDPNAVGVMGPCQLFVSVWQRIQSKVLDGTDNFCDIIRRDLSKILFGGFTPSYREAIHPVLARQESLGD